MAVEEQKQQQRAFGDDARSRSTGPAMACAALAEGGDDVTEQQQMARVSSMDGIDAELACTKDERQKLEEALVAGAPMGFSSVTFDKDLYGSDLNRFTGYIHNIRCH